MLGSFSTSFRTLLRLRDLKSYFYIQFFVNMSPTFFSAGSTAYSHSISRTPIFLHRSHRPFRLCRADPYVFSLRADSGTHFVFIPSLNCISAPQNSQVILPPVSSRYRPLFSFPQTGHFLLYIILISPFRLCRIRASRKTGRILFLSPSGTARYRSFR